jgi:gluconate 2-dehydrogenase gamma chain
MDRRDSLRILAWGTLSTGVLAEACKPSDKKQTIQSAAKGDSTASINRMVEETAAYNKVIAEKFFTDHELATIALLCDIIIPRDSISGSATDAKVPDFIEFIVKDKPEFQTPMRGGLRWLDLHSVRTYNKSFRDCSQQQQIAIVDEIAYPAKAKPEVTQGVSFFNLIRNLTATGFYTSEIGLKDVGYMGNQPNQWNGVPDDVLRQYGLSYTEKELKECVSFT